MGLSMKKGILLHGVRVAWIQLINAGAITELLHIDKLGPGSSYKKILSSSATTENTDIIYADGAMTRFPKASVIIDGISEEELVSDSSGSGRGEITLEMVGTPNDASITSWTNFLQVLDDHDTDYFLVALAVGFSYYERYEAATKKADGYFYMVCKRTSDIEQSVGNNAITLSITFKSFMPSSLNEANFTGATWTPIDMTLGGSNKITLTPPALVSADASYLLNGIPIWKEST